MSTLDDAIRSLHQARIFLAETVFHLENLRLDGLREEVERLKERVRAIEMGLKQ